MREPYYRKAENGKAAYHDAIADSRNWHELCFSAASHPRVLPMRLLPMTSRSTWALAAVIWLASCAGVWSVLPIRPRASWELEEPTVFCGFGMDDKTILTCPNTWKSGSSASLKFDWVGHIRATSSGEILRGLTRNELSERRTPDRRWGVVLSFADNGIARLIDHWGIRPDVLLDGVRGYGYTFQSCFGPDGQLLAYSNWAQGAGVTVMEVGTGRPVAVLKGMRPPFAFSGNGRWLAAAAIERRFWSNSAEIHVWECSDWRQPVTKISLSERGWLDRLIFSDNGSRLAIRIGGRLQCIDAMTGQRLFEVPDGHGRFAFNSDGRTLLAECAGTAAGARAAQGYLHGHLRWCDVDNGEVRAEVPCLVAALEGQEFDGSHLRSPRGDVVKTVQDSPATPSRLEKAVTWLGLRWPFASVKQSVQLWDAATAQPIGELPGEASYWSPDGRAIAVVSNIFERPLFELWDVPPRKPLTWFLFGAALLGMSLLRLARNRVWRLRNTNA